MPKNRFSRIASYPLYTTYKKITKYPLYPLGSTYLAHVCSNQLKLNFKIYVYLIPWPQVPKARSVGRPYQSN